MEACIKSVREELSFGSIAYLDSHGKNILVLKKIVEMLSEKINEIIEALNLDCDHEWISEDRGGQAVAVCKKCRKVSGGHG